jgi:hypothetical protein
MLERPGLALARSTLERVCLGGIPSSTLISRPPKA